MRNLVLAVLAAVALIGGNTESKWTVTKGKAAVGTITLLTSPKGTRAEWKAAGQPATIIFLGGSGKVWVRTTGGDVELATISNSNIENTVAPALLLPFTTSAADAVESKDGKPTTYSYRGSKATYAYDAKGPFKIDVKSAGQTYTLTRTSLASSNADASNFAIRPKKGAASRLARLSGDLLGPSDTTVAATAGGRGVGTKGLKLNDGGDYSAVEKLENRDAAWKEKLESALSEFQKDGKVGKSRENQ
ncbi:MAG TPA: hypothetical protein VII12_04510 [Thermoanaerobaculia bacterium]|jgi:hypothetical protein